MIIQQFTKYLKSDKKFLEAYNIVKKNGKGNIWLIGGALSRNLSNIIHKEKLVTNHDYDFVIEKLNKKIILPKEWKYGENKFGSPKITKGKISVDIIPLNKVKLANKNPLRNKMKRFLEGVPFTPQAIAYNIKKEEIFGETGMKAIKEKTFRINNKKQAKIYAKGTGITVKELAKKKAQSMKYQYKE